MPVFYECQRCTECCRWPGQVRLAAGEIAKIASHLGMLESEFIQNHTRLSTDRKGLALMDKSNGECAFLDGELCRIQPVKPQQCRDFPNLWNFPKFEQVCRAIPHVIDSEEYKRRILAATGRILDDQSDSTSGGVSEEKSG